MTPPRATTHEPRPRCHVYSWAEQGNIGDDWLFEVAEQHVEVLRAREERTVRRLGRLELVPRADEHEPLLLWGGGWLAADRPGSDTLRRWARHLGRRGGPVAGVGLGIGPFHASAAGDEGRLHTVLGALSSLSVRTSRDLELLPPRRSAVLACDLAILDRRFTSAALSGPPASRPFVALAAPAWQEHWLLSRPWLTEARYRHHVERAVSAAEAPLRQIVFDRTHAAADERYWAYLGGDVQRPRTVEQAATLLTQASHVIAGRLHAALLAALLGRPTVAIGYHHKFDAVSELGLEVAGRSELQEGWIRYSTAVPDDVRSVRARGASVVRAQLDALGS